MQAVLDGVHDVVVLIPESIGDDLASATPSRIEVISDQSNTTAEREARRAIRALSAEVGIPPSLAAFDVVKPEDFGTLADNAMKDACGATNPKQPMKDEVIALFQAAYQGQAA